MIFLDTNVIIRFLVAPGTDQDRLWRAQSRVLMRGIASGTIRATMSEVVIHEVCYILGSKRHFQMHPSEIIARMRSILALYGMWFEGGEGAVFQRAFELWAEHPKLEFADSVIAARCERSGHELATFDRHFADLPFIALWRPEAAPSLES